MKKILIVEDDEAIAEIERDYLLIQGFAVEIAPDGKAGLELALNGSFSLIILDVMLPEIDGFSLCRTLREKLDIPIIMVTARKDDIDKIRGLGLGADDYVVKPFSPGELVARVRSHIAAYERIANGTSRGNARAAESSGDITTVAVHINRLREKFSASTNIIETVWGAGYRFQR